MKKSRRWLTGWKPDTDDSLRLHVPATAAVLGRYELQSLFTSVKVNDQPASENAILATPVNVCHQMRAMFRDGIQRPDASFMLIRVATFN